MVAGYLTALFQTRYFVESGKTREKGAISKEEAVAYSNLPAFFLGDWRKPGR
jgi:hypothetical protein